MADSNAAREAAREIADTIRVRGSDVPPPVVIHWSAALDNHDPPRRWDMGYGVRYTHPITRAPGYQLWTDMPEPPRRAVYLIDDGATVVPHYVAGWLANRGSIVVQPMPANGDWLGPRRAYHLKVTDVPNGA